jgi:FMN phosphatase YigB (HAD superfamily)
MDSVKPDIVFFDLDQTLVDYIAATKLAISRLIRSEPLLHGVSAVIRPPAMQSRSVAGRKRPEEPLEEQID